MTEKDLNSTIAEAVKARIEAEVTRALSGDEVFASFVTAALQQTVETKPDGYRVVKVPYLTHVLTTAIKEATKAAVQRLVQESLPELELEIRKALRRDIKGIAEALTSKLDQAVGSAYGFKVDLTLNVPKD